MENKAIFAITIGNRDLQLDGEVIKPARNGGERAFEILKNSPDRFSIPIILPALNTIKDEIERIFLIVTDQPEGFIDEKHRQNDTIIFGKIIKELLDQHFKKIGLNKKPAAKCEIICIGENPTILSALLRDKQNCVLNKFLHQRNLGCKKLHLLATGGIPTLNAAVILMANRAFKGDLNLLRVNDNGMAFPDPISIELEKIELANLIAKLSENWSFQQIKMRLEESGINEEPFNQIEVLCHAMSRRLVFDFSGALELLSNNFASAGRFMSVFESQINDISPFLKLDQIDNARSKLISELLLNIIFKFKQQEYVDAAGRVFRMLEELAFMILEKIVGKSFPFTENEKGYPAFKEYVEKNKELLNFCFKEKIDYSKLNIFTAEKTLDFLKDSREITEPNRSLIKEYLYIHNQLINLKQLRNKSIIAHGFRSISKDNFPKDFIVLVKKLGLMIGVSEPDKSILNLVAKINESVI
ncbi:MAG: hypothetical protein ACOYXC_15215 [Candidatus Rifleibacteriota bacterium]